MNSFDAITPCRTICLETANHKSTPDLGCSQYDALEGSKMQPIFCLDTLSNATNYFHFVALGHQQTFLSGYVNMARVVSYKIKGE